MLPWYKPGVAGGRGDRTADLGLSAAPGRRSWILAAAALGAAWGIAAYAILWGQTSIVVTVAYVQSPLGLVTLMPVRIVLYVLRALEWVRGQPFNFSRNHAWIGLVSAGVGALMALAGAWAGRWVFRRVRGA